MKDLLTVKNKMEEAVEKKIFPGAVLLVSAGEELVFHKAFGFRSILPQKEIMAENTIFDIASLTKVVATKTAIMILIKEGKINLEDRVLNFIPEFNCKEKEAITIRHLLNHCSGIPDWLPFYRKWLEKKDDSIPICSKEAKQYIYQRINREPLVYLPGQDFKYSDIGFLILGEIIEILTESSLDKFCEEKIFNPLSLQNTFFLNLLESSDLFSKHQNSFFAATENCPWRNKILQGEVHDDNAYAMGGVAGHSGLFSTSMDIHNFALEILRCYKGEGEFLPQRIVKEFLLKQNIVRDSSWALGWDTPSRGISTSGHYFSDKSVGHLGFTGTSIWIDLEREIIVILLTNRVHPTREQRGFTKFRPEIHDLIMKKLGVCE